MITPMPLLILTFLTLAAVSPQRWELQASGVTARLRGVSVVNQRVAWASGAAGTILRTADGGRTWQRLTIAGTGSLDFRDIDAVDERTACVLSIGPGEASRIYRTTDAGLTWTQVFRNTVPQAFYDSLTFSSKSRALAVSDSVDHRFLLLATQNGGVSWSPIASEKLPPALPGEGAFAASGSNIAAHGRHVWVATGAGRVLRSADPGRNWQVSQTGLAASPTAGIFSIAFRDHQRGIVVGGDYKRETFAQDNAALTRDGGRTWQLVSGLGGFRSAVVWLGDAVLAVGPSGTDLSSDGGETWRAFSPEGFHAVSHARGATWAVGEAGRIARLR